MWGRLRRQVDRLRHRRDWLPTCSRLADGRSIALTFDDGPSPASTPLLLEVLRAKRVRAAFFLNGARAERRPELVEAIVRHGHDVFPHGYDHIRLDALPDEDLVGQIDRCEQVLRRHRPTPRPYFVRLPYGSGHDDPRVHRALRRWRPDCRIAHWGYSLEDFRLAEGCATQDELERRVAAAVDAAFASPRFRGAVVLLHEEPFDVDAPLAADVAPMLARALLDRASRTGLQTASPAQPAAFASRAPKPGRLVAFRLGEA